MQTPFVLIAQFVASNNSLCKECFVVSKLAVVVGAPHATLLAILIGGVWGIVPTQCPLFVMAVFMRQCIEQWLRNP